MSINIKNGFMGWFIVLYSIVGLVLGINFKGVNNEEFYAAFKYFSLPYLVLCLGFFYITIRGGKVTLGGIGVILFCYIVLVGFGSGYIVFINENVGVQSPITIQGKIVGKRKKRGRYRYRYYIWVWDRKSSQQLKIELNSNEYSSLMNKNIYFKEWYVGSLGVMYR